MWLNTVWHDPYLRGVVFRALLVGGLVSLCAALLGVTLVLKRFSMIGDGLSHVGFGALAIAAVFGVAGEFSMEFTLPIVTVAAFLLLTLSAKGKLSGDAAIAVISSTAVALGVILYDITGGMTADACSSLFGSASVLTLSGKDVIISVVLAITVIVLFVLLYHRIFAMTFDETFASATGMAGGGYRAVVSLLTSVTVVIGMKMMGAVMISALIIFPVLCAMRLRKSFHGVVVAAAICSIGCFLVGFAVACLLGLPTGPSVVVVNVAFLGILAIFTRR